MSDPKDVEEFASPMELAVPSPQSDNTPKPRKKSVGFAPLPEEDLKEHHKQLKKKEQEKMKSNPFHRIPPELAYLEKNKAPAPKPLPLFEKPKPTRPRRTSTSTLGDLKRLSIKDLSVQNKDTELNFNYPVIERPIAAHHIIVDIKYGSLNSFDLSKINKYLLNVSNVKVGLGYGFSGVISEIGATITEFAIGDFVIGITDPRDRKGSLSSSLLISPNRDVLIRVEQDVLDKIDKIDINLAFENVENEFEIEDDDEDGEGEEEVEEEPVDEAVDEDVPKNSVASFKNRVGSKNPFALDGLTALAKLSSFQDLYCRAKQILTHLPLQNNTANILINGADTNLGYTLIQILNSSAYPLDKLNLILIIQDKNLDNMSKFVDQFTKGKYYSVSTVKKISLVTHDLANEDIVLPNEKVPMNFKKAGYFATQVFEAMFATQYYDNDKLIDETNINDFKLDMIVDIVGSKKFFQTSGIQLDKLDELQLPIHKHLNCSLTKLFNGKVKEPLLVKILKPKRFGSCFVSSCKFHTKGPTYNVNTLIDHSESVMNPWASKWSGNLMNNLAAYSFYDETELRINKDWVIEGLDLLLANMIKFKIDHFIDWRDNFKKHLGDLRKQDGMMVIKVEDF